MGSRALLFFAILLAPALTSCPGLEEARPEPIAIAAAAPQPAPPPPGTPAPPTSSGAIVARRADPIHRGNCNEGWYRIEPRGYVCVNFAATTSTDDPVVQLSSRRPARDNLPYTYAMSRFPPPPFYARLPTAAETLEA